MNHTQRPRSNTPTNHRATLSTRQLVDLELGLYLLRHLRPSAPPTALPDLLSSAASATGQARLTPQQHKYLHRARLLLAHVANPNHWQALLDAYTAAPADRLAFDLSRDHSRFAEKSVGFSRNRIAVLRKMLA
ncbi:hypothetical protein [Spirosoma montaniterrae]|uniref:pPIWI-RE three-gene island domain-containing protein n=1 Tax=Spirosoma montaniterrae TaxID=1178516 RepID=A0A1P9WT33_9BACT|nr:hypothetical protein [Spirosoma montaniterrae]AQG78522.1 hypothetical protein AWR27_03700 [Spirosoma montaniterrae]